MNPLKAALDKLSLQELGTAVRSLYAASAHREILDRADTSLVLVDGVLINTLSGEYREVGKQGDEPGDEEGTTTLPARIARAARELLPMRESPPSIVLLLPPADFAVTRFNLALSGDKLLRSALKLQQHTLIPAFEEELLLGLHSGGSSEGVALWYPERQANELFTAFEAQGLFLAALMPRTLALLQTRESPRDEVLLDEDQRHTTVVVCKQDSVRALTSLRKVDLEQEAFAAQWQAELARSGTVTLHAAGQETWRELRRVIRPLAPYCYFAAGAEKLGRELIAQNQRRVFNIAAAVLVAALFLPFLNNWVQIQILESRVENLRDASASARQSQGAVFAMEDEWGPVAEYPRQDVAKVLLALDELIDSDLSSFEIDRGVVEITGFARDPALLIEQLAEREDFFNVGQSGTSTGDNSSSRGERFSINFNVSGVDFPAYEDKYPVVEP